MNKTQDINKIRDFAVSRHDAQGQTWGGHPYGRHLELVAEAAERWAKKLGLPQHIASILIAAAWLHDIIEDTGTTIEEVRAVAGEEVAEIVWCVTDEPGANRKERKEKTLPKTAKNSLAVFLKLCDREVNVQNSVQNPESRQYLAMYKKEHPALEKALRKGDEWKDIWDHLAMLLGSK